MDTIKTNYKIVRFLSKLRVRGLCVKYRLYTTGCNRDYDKMLDACHVAKDDNSVIAIAKDIWDHSETENLDIDFEELIWMLAAMCTEICLDEIPAQEMEA